jgi:uncharacterized protein
MPITILSRSAEVRMPDHEPLATSLSQPPNGTATLGIDLEGAGTNQTGLWECTPGRFERSVVEAEIMHILAGACTFTPEGGEPREISAGDTLFFPANTRGMWDVRETVRKLYVICS